MQLPKFSGKFGSSTNICKVSVVGFAYFWHLNSPFLGSQNSKRGYKKNKNGMRMYVDVGGDIYTWERDYSIECHFKDGQKI